MSDKIRKGRTVNIVFSQKDYASLRKKYEASTCRTFSQFLRDTAFHRPIRTIYRNQSIEDFLVIAIDIKNNLDTLLRHCNPSSAVGAADFAILRQKVEEIKYTMHQIYQQCSFMSPPPSGSAQSSDITNGK